MDLVVIESDGGGCYSDEEDEEIGICDGDDGVVFFNLLAKMGSNSNDNEGKNNANNNKNKNGNNNKGSSRGIPLGTKNNDNTEIIKTVKRKNTKRGVGVATTAAATDDGSIPSKFQTDSRNQRKFHHASIISDLTLENTTRYQGNNTRDYNRRQKKNHLLIYCSPPPPPCIANSPLFPAFVELGKDDDDEEEERIALYQSTTNTLYIVLPQIRQTRLQFHSLLIDKTLGILTDVRVIPFFV